MGADGWTPAAIFGLATCIKFLLFPSYLSTDFDVHRNWLALTYSLPLKDWYFEDTSEWTLDYPPFFAYFEWALAQVAAIVDPAIVKISAEPYRSPVVVSFQRTSVIVTDLVLYMGVLSCISAWQPVVSRLKASALSALVLLNAGLFMVDHMHFQYNGMLLGILLLSIAQIRQGRVVLGAVLFASLLMFKHLFLSLAPAYFIYLLSHYCFVDSSSNGNKKQQTATTTTPSFSLVRFVSLGVAVLSTFSLALLPFLLNSDPAGQMKQIIARLFPFGRGLVHAYWAPNAYAIYCLTDTALAFLYRKAGKLPPSLSSLERPTWTSGLVQDIQPEVLFKVTPPMTALLTLLSMGPALVSVWRHRDGTSLAYGLFQVSFCTYMFGWHVHEKAIIVSIVLLALAAVEDPRRYGRLYLWLSFIGHASLFPLFPPLSPETPTKLTLFLLSTTTTTTTTTTTLHHLPLTSDGGAPLLYGISLLEWAYALGMVVVITFTEVVHPVWVVHRLPFLARLAMSSYCVCGVAICFIQSYRLLGPPPSPPPSKAKGE